MNSEQPVAVTWGDSGLHVQARRDLLLARHRAAYIRHPVETLVGRMHPLTWEAFLLHQEYRARMMTEQEEILEEMRAPGGVEPVSMYGVQIVSRADRSVRPGRVAVGCSWQAHISDDATFDSLGGHPMSDVVERTADWSSRGGSVAWLVSVGDLRFEQRRGFPVEPEYVIRRGLSRLVCRWSNAKEEG